MKVAIIAPYATVAPHFEAELELGQLHLERGDEVAYLSCEGELANCDFNLERDPLRCDNCRGRRAHGFDLLSGNFQTVQLKGGNAAVPEFASLQQLIDFKVDGFDVGYGALSSLVSVCRDPEPNLQQHAELLRKFISSALATFRQTCQFIEANRPDRVYVFNGRFAAMRAVFRACEKMGVECFLHERGCDMHHYDLYENHMPHDIDGIESVVRKLWASADPTKRDAIGASWYEDRVQRIERNWHSFTKEQQSGMLPQGFDATARNVSIFTSSDDEFVAIGDKWQNSLYPNQVDAIQAIADSMKETSPETRLYVRVHPNQKDVDNARTRRLVSLSSPNLTIVRPEDAVDSYALMHASDTVVSFGSSVGMESVFWGRPSVLLGPCLYQNLGGPYRSGSHDETIDLLGRKLEPAADKTGALMYGHWFQARGYRYRFFEAETLFEGRFKGEIVHDRDAAKLAAKKKKRSKFSLFK